MLMRTFLTCLLLFQCLPSFAGPATKKVAEQYNAAKQPDSADLSLGVTLGLKYFYPSLHFQIAVTDNLSLGIMPTYMSYTEDTKSVTFYGTYLTMTYYYTHKCFNGLNFQGGLGFFHIAASTPTITEQKADPLAAKFTVGWRGQALIGFPLSLGADAGLQYIMLKTAPLDTSFKGLQPMLHVFAAYTF